MFDLKKKQKSFGKNTKDALNAGFIWGYEGLINNIISKITINWKMNYKIILRADMQIYLKKLLKRDLLLIKILQLKVLQKFIENFYE